MASNKTRKEAYRFYRSLGYTSKQASNLRNKSKSTLSNEYRAAARRTPRGDFDGETVPPARLDPYRPELSADGEHTRDKLDLAGMPGRFDDQLYDNQAVDLIDLEVFNDRITGLRLAMGEDAWQEKQAELKDVDDLGDYLDALGEVYDETK